jgi:hypothetical protein
MINCKGFGRKRSWPNFKAQRRYSPGGTEENHRNPKSGYPVSRPRFEHGTSRIGSRLVNHSTDVRWFYVQRIVIVYRKLIFNAGYFKKNCVILYNMWARNKLRTRHHTYRRSDVKLIVYSQVWWHLCLQCLWSFSIFLCEPPPMYDTLKVAINLRTELNARKLQWYKNLTAFFK